MKRWWILKGLKITVVIAAAVSLVGYLVMSLWNWLLPPLFGWHALGFAQALGLLVLCRLLFGGFRGHHGGWRRGAWRERMRARWEAMTPEERARVRSGLHRRGACGRTAADPQ